VVVGVVIDDDDGLCDRGERSTYLVSGVVTL